MSKYFKPYSFFVKLAKRKSKSVSIVKLANKKLLMTILKGDHIGEKLIIGEGDLLWGRGDHWRFETNFEFIRDTPFEYVLAEKYKISPSCLKFTRPQECIFVDITNNERPFHVRCGWDLEPGLFKQIYILILGDDNGITRIFIDKAHALDAATMYLFMEDLDKCLNNKD